MLRLGTILLGSALVVAGHGMAAAQTASGEIDFMTFGDPAEKAAYETLVAAFEATHPEIDVTIVHVPDQADYRRRLATDFSAGTPADIVFINYRRYASLAAKGAIEPLGPYLAKSSVIEESDFYAETTKPFYWEGKLQCIPQNLSSLVVYYNKSLFDAAGAQYPADDWNWDDFLATAKALTKDTDGDGTIDQYGLGTEASIFRLAPFVWQNGGDIVDDPENPKRLTLDTAEAREAVAWFP
jgi:multiple sugar transport system substrate-binding protein